MNRSLVSRLVQGGGLSFVKLCTGLAKIKMLALLLGVEGVGLLSLGLQFQMTAAAVLSMSLAVGVINLGRPLWVRGETSAVGGVVGTALALVALNSVIFVVGMASMPIWLGVPAHQLFGAGEVSIWPLAIAAVMSAVSTALWEGLSFLLDRFDIYVRTNIVGAVGDATLFALGAWAYGLPGAFAASLAGSLLLLVVYSVLCLKAEGSKAILSHVRIDMSQIRPLVTYCTLMLSTTGLGLAAQFGARLHLTNVAGQAANGYLQVVTALSAYLLPFVMTGVWGHLHPSASASGDTGQARVELRKTLSTSIRLGAAGCIAVVLASPALVPLVYTKAFLEARPLIPIYFAGEIGFMILSVMGAYLLAVGHKRAYLAGYLLYYGILVAGVLLLSTQFGPLGYVLAHVASSTIALLVALTHALRRQFIDSKTCLILSLSVLGVIGTSLLDWSGSMVPGTSVPLAWLAGLLAITALLAPYFRPALQLIATGRMSA